MTGCEWLNVLSDNYLHSFGHVKIFIYSLFQLYILISFTFVHFPLNTSEMACIICINFHVLLINCTGFCFPPLAYPILLYILYVLSELHINFSHSTPSIPTQKKSSSTVLMDKIRGVHSAWFLIGQRIEYFHGQIHRDSRSSVSRIRHNYTTNINTTHFLLLVKHLDLILQYLWKMKGSCDDYVFLRAPYVRVGEIKSKGHEGLW